MEQGIQTVFPFQGVLYAQKLAPRTSDTGRTEIRVPFWNIGDFDVLNVKQVPLRHIHELLGDFVCTLSEVLLLKRSGRSSRHLFAQPTPRWIHMLEID